MISFLIEENEGIKNFLEGSDSYIPTSELIYLHTHPLVRPNFLTEVNDLVMEVGKKIVAKKITGHTIEKLSGYAVEIGLQMDGELTEDKAKAALFAIRGLYTFCKDLRTKL